MTARDMSQSRIAKVRSFLSRWAPVLAWMALIFFVSSQSSHPGPRLRPYSLEDIVVSKSAHIIQYSIFGFLLLRAQWSRTRPFSRRHYFIAFAIPVLYAVSDEFHQSLVPGRIASVWDVVVDGAGAGIALTVAILTRRT